MKLKVQTEILKHKTTHYKTKYQEIDQEIIIEIIELFLIEANIPNRIMGKTAKRIKKNQENPLTKNYIA